MNNFKATITPKLKPYAKYIPEISKLVMRSHLKLCVAFLEHQKYSKEAFDKEAAKLTAANSESPANHDIYCTIIMILLETFLKFKKPVDDLNDILRELKFQEECVEDLSKVLSSNQQSLSEQLHEMKSIKPLEGFKFRINVSLVESGQPPTVILHHEQKGQTRTFNLSLKQFHRLRLAVASSLAEVQTLDNKKN